MAPFDSSHTTFNSSAIVNIALSCNVFELFDVAVLEVTQDISKGYWYHSKAWVQFPNRLPL